MSRIARIIAIEYPHHIVQRGNNKQVIFFDDADKQLYLKLLKKFSKECGCKIKAYCLMKNHVHLLLIPNQRNSIAKTMQKLSLTFTQYFNKKYNRTGRLWECRFYSSVIDKEMYLFTVCRYIERNPVRAKIVEMPRDYKWSSAIINTTSNYDDKDIEPVWKDYVDVNDYINILHQPDEDKEINNVRLSTLKGIPIGKEGFIKQITDLLGININTNPVGRPKRK